MTNLDVLPLPPTRDDGHVRIQGIKIVEWLGARSEREKRNSNKENKRPSVSGVRCPGDPSQALSFAGAGVDWALLSVTV